MSDSSHEVSALEVAQAALQLSKQTSARVDAMEREFRSGHRSCYEACGEIRRALAVVEALIKDVQSHLMIDSVRPPPPDDSNGDV